jgi:hypothetical protein
MRRDQVGGHECAELQSDDGCQEALFAHDAPRPDDQGSQQTDPENQTAGGMAQHRL